MSTINFLFGNPKRKGSGGKSMATKRKTSRKTTKRKNPMVVRVTSAKGKVTKSKPFLTASEKLALTKHKRETTRELNSLKKGLALAVKEGNKGSLSYKGAERTLKEVETLNKKLRSKLTANKKAYAQAKKMRDEAKAQKLKVEILRVSSNTKNEIKKAIKKAEAKLGKLGAKKAMAATKEGKAMATRRKTAKNGAKNATAKKGAKNATAKKGAKNATAKKAAPKKPTAKKGAKKPTAKKGAKKPTAKKAAPKKKATKRTTLTSVKKRISKATAKKGGIRKGKSVKQKIVRGKRKYSNITKRLNPIGGKTMKGLKIYLKHEMTEMAGLAVGGMGTSLFEGVFAKFAPNAYTKAQGVFKSSLGAVLGLASGVGLGILNQKFLKNNKNLDMFAKGVIGASVVMIGKTAYETAANFAPLPVAIPMLPSTDMGYTIAGIDYDSQDAFQGIDYGSQGDFRGIDYGSQGDFQGMFEANDIAFN